MKILKLAIIIGAILGFSFLADGESQCDFYASPSGSGTVGSASNPFKVSAFWSVAGPNSTLCLLDGIYRGSDSMIAPPVNMSGNLDAPITIRALNDGEVVLDGQFQFIPIHLVRNSHFVIEGIDAHSSSASVVDLSRSDYNVIRRVVAWDAAEGNYKVFSVTSGYPLAETDGHNLFEDIAGFGIGRKIFSSFTADHTTVRRGWFSWDGSHFVGPKMALTLAYRNYNMTVENVMARWTGALMKDSYTLGCDANHTYSKCGQTLTSPDQAQGIISTDGLDKNLRAAVSRLYGSIAYIEDSAKHWTYAPLRITQPSVIEWRDVVSYIEPGRYTNTIRPAEFMNRDAPYGRIVDGATLVGGTTYSLVHGAERVENVVSGATVADVPSIYGDGGAKLCKRYVNGVLTDEPLWPWPMNQRIIDAMIQAGREPVDVTATIDRILGPIPDECRKIDEKKRFCDDMARQMEATMSTLLVDMNNLVSGYCSAN